MLEFKLIVYACEQYRRPWRFGDVVDRAQFESVFFVTGIEISGDKNDRYVTACWLCAQAPQGFVTIHPRHFHIEQYE